MESLSEISRKLDTLLAGRGIKKYSHTVFSGEKQEFNLDGGEFSLFRTTFDNNANVSVFMDDRQGTVSGNDFDEKALEHTVDDAILAAENARPDPAKDIAPDQGRDEFFAGVQKPDLDRFFERVKEFAGNVGKEYPLIRLMTIYAAFTKSDSVYHNSNGTTFLSHGGFYSFVAEFAGNDGTRTTGLNAGGILVKDLDTPFLEQKAIRLALDEAVGQLNQTTIPGKFEGTVILTPSSAENFLRMLLGNYISGSVILDGTSLWREKLGEKVADEKFTVISNPYDERFVVGERFTGDGFRSEEVTYIENGVLKNFQLGLYVANKTGLTPTKNSGQSYLITPGDKTLEEMIKSVKKGLIVGGFSGGAPGTNGEFSGVAKNSVYIEDGEVKGAVSETMINGNLAEMFAHINAISKETVCDGSSVFPYIAVDGIVISGK